ncbi:hypothetical protein SLEP1_g51847 [Rubroshorea leprosula]|uniref:Uncharacterized protein n=1 Tax=Rubroshorea leprosula TaxID=152421 RepID=A0AAV5M5I6_9ROSI|nr:hypothetical protein SLEP1_g51847 [Rubroshorea leprosula]
MLNVPSKSCLPFHSPKQSLVLVSFHLLSPSPVPRPSPAPHRPAPRCPAPRRPAPRRPAPRRPAPRRLLSPLPYSD